VANLKIGSNKSLNDCWYLDLSGSKHVSRNKCSFRGLENYVEIQNVKFVEGQTNGVYMKGKVKLFSTFGKIKTIVDVLYA
jgi:hypothetical protein